MISKNEVFARVASAITAEYPTAYVVSRRIQSPQEFPAAWIVEIDSHPVAPSTSMTLTADHRQSTFEIQTFSNNTADPEGEAERIIDIASETMRTCGYLLQTKTPIDNGYDLTIGRYVARYSRVIGDLDTLPELENN